ncbi:unnamed protein product [Echinostoma caproni]|uniref:RING-type domain-containing protein n=1 Tax=Echinostoma caproni TaxID=27848 RepID=A0A183AI73_9TREM|nr:unnamed protein product [Echinostoma caproni]
MRYCFSGFGGSSLDLECEAFDFSAVLLFYSMSSKKISQTALSSPDLASLAGSVTSEDRLDSDLEADLQQAELLVENVHGFDIDHFSITSSEAFSCSNALTEGRPRLGLGDSNLKPSTFVRKAILSGVSNQLKSASSKVDIGSPSCLASAIACCAHFASALINLQQVLRFCFGTLDSTAGTDAQTTAGQGAVTTLSQNVDGTQLLSGYQSGRIAVWRLSGAPSSPGNNDAGLLQGKLTSHEVNDSVDQEYVLTGAHSDNGSPRTNQSSSISSSTLNATPARSSLPRRFSEAKMRLIGRKSTTDTITGQLLCVLDDAHGVGQAIAFVNFTTAPSLAVAVDTGGSVFALNFNRGEICALDALGSTTLPSEPSDHEPAISDPSDRGAENTSRSGRSLRAYALVAMASFTKLIVAQLRPRLQIAHWQPLKGPPACLPLVTWMWTPHAGLTGPENALLAFGRGCSLHVLQVATGPFPAGLDPMSTIRADESRSHSLHFSLLYSFELDYELISLNVSFPFLFVSVW